MNAPASTAANNGERLRAAAAAKRASFADPGGDPMAGDTAAPTDAPSGAAITLGLVAEDGTPIGDIGTINYDGDPSEVDNALAGVQIVFTSPDVVDLAPLQSALEGLGITEANLNPNPPDGIPPEGGTYTVAVVGGGGDNAAPADTSTPAAPSFSWRRPGDFGAVGLVDDSKVQPKWQGLLVVEGIPSGDGRQIDFDALTWRNLPLPLMMMTRNPVGGEGHDGAELAGRIDKIERKDNGEIWGSGILDSGSPAGQEAMRLLTPDADGFTLLRGVSVDLDDVEMAFEGPEGIIDIGDLGISAPMKVARGRIMGATLTPFPAFQEAQVTLVSDNALIAAMSGGGCDCDHEAALIASAGDPMKGAQVRVFTPFGPDALVASAGVSPVIPIRPPVAWFECPPHDTIADEAVRISTNGQVWGLCADDKACHIGFADRCVRTPKSHANYRYFANKQCETAEGVMVASGPIFMDTVHPSLKLKASDAQAFYAHTGCAVADVAIYDTPKGMYVAGAVRPSATPEQIRALRGSDISPDWRIINGRLECVALLAVNTSGFITPLVASAGAEALDGAVKPGKVAVEVSFETGEILALVAAGMKPHFGSVDALRSEVETLRATVDQMVSAQLAERKAAALTKLNARRQRELDLRFTQASARFKQRVISTERRKELADKGKAMADGSYPIPDKGALRRAIQSYGRASDPEAVKAHIIRQAKALNAVDMLPPDWNVKTG